MANLQAVSIFDPLEYLTSAELDRLDTQFDSVLAGTSCLVFWTGIPQEVVRGWAGKNGLKTLTIAMGPLFDSSRRPKSKKDRIAWSRYMKGASVRFAQYACQGRQAIVLTNPPPSIYSLRIGSTFRNLEEPVLKGACGGLSATRIDFVHPTVDGAADFRYEAWPCDNTREWITFFVNTLHRKLDNALNKYAMPFCKHPTQDGPVTQGIEQWDLFNNACNGAIGGADPLANRYIGAGQQNKEGEVTRPPKMQKLAQEKGAARQEKVQAQLQKQQKLVQEKRAARQEKVQAQLQKQQKLVQEKRAAKQEKVREQEKQAQEKRDAKRQQVQEREKQVQEKRDVKQEKVREQEKRAQDKRDAKRQRVREQEKQAQEKKDAKRQKVREQEKQAQEKRDAKQQKVREQEKQAQEKRDAKQQKVREQEKRAQDKRDAKRQRVREQEKQAQEKKDAKRQKVREQEKQAQEKRDAKRQKSQGTG